METNTIMKRLLMNILVCVAIAMPVHAYTVVIDAGHGGDDPGAIGRMAREKVLNLDAQ